MLYKVFRYSFAILAIGLVTGSWSLAHAALLGGTPIAPAGEVDGKSRNVFEFILKEGETKTDQLIVTNNTEQASRIFVFPSGFELEGDQIIEVPSADPGAEEPGRWIKIDRSEVTLQPGTAATIGFSITAPDNADVGDHLATLFAQGISTQGRAARGSGLNINVRNGVRVYITVPGAIQRDLVIDNISHKTAPFWKLFSKKLLNYITLTNKGNVTLRPTGSITIRGFFGEVGEQTDLKFATVRRGQTVSVEKEWIKRAPFFGRFVANYELHLGEREQVNEDGTKTILPDEVIKARYVFWIFPWIEVIYLIVIIFFLYLLRTFWLYIIVINRLKTKTEIYTVAKGDSLTAIGSKLGINPRILVKFNLIPWPYEVHPGDKLLIPTGKYTGREWHGRVIDMVKDQNIWAGIWGHLFRKRNVYKLTYKHIQISGQAASKPRTVIVEGGDTIEDVADFLGVDKEEVIKANHLRPPYRLKAGQELKVPITSRDKPKKASRRRKK